ncbi:nitric oxide synthase oxygenase [Micromonospora yangpuensis]|uniref:nitric oxide synthase oxygenase n=1 Tax=Micromonospora yangpuensis TaxID=683228 RepID=UPI001586C75D|nr:nitric oxide synthase oxygenase [Micromonospora yangpuensis]GGM05681.1 nitric oxide synthase oxygenase [Micromonospora yangpuensis]
MSEPCVREQPADLETARVGRPGSGCPVTAATTAPTDPGERPLSADRRPTSLAEEAVAFLRTCAQDLGWDARRHRQRRLAVLAEIASTGTYAHTFEELEYGAKLAWRNHTRCIGQLYWRTLIVRDRRDVATVDGVVQELEQHLDWAYHDGGIRPVITVFAPDAPGARGPSVANAQLVRYAGYRQPDGSVRGDPANAELTDLLVGAGWQPRSGMFDRLPVLVHGRDGCGWRELDPRTCPDIPITHPSYDWFADLGLRWYAYPTVSDMQLEIGGVVYPGAPFTGWYVAAEIGARNFGDVERYNLLPTIAKGMGLDTSGDRTLWKDRALIELTVAVLTSFEAAGVRMVDHHTMTDQFHRYTQARRRAGETVYAEWGWIVPPIAGSATPVYRETYDSTVIRPNFFRR